MSVKERNSVISDKVGVGVENDPKNIDQTGIQEKDDRKFQELAFGSTTLPNYE